jgi:uncharacterized membrane protein
MAHDLSLSLSLSQCIYIAKTLTLSHNIVHLTIFETLLFSLETMANMKVFLFFILILLFFSTFETRSIDRISHQRDRSLIETAQEMLKESIARHELIEGFNESFRLSPGGPDPRHH